MSLAHDGLPPLREVAATYGLDPKKSLGQNFLFDLNLTGRIARAAGPLAGVAVIEIGPGPGGLTRALLSAGAAKVIAVERDERCLAIGGNRPSLARPARNHRRRRSRVRFRRPGRERRSGAAAHLRQPALQYRDAVARALA